MVIINIFLLNKSHLNIYRATDIKLLKLLSLQSQQMLEADVCPNKVIKLYFRKLINYFYCYTA